MSNRLVALVSAILWVASASPALADWITVVDDAIAGWNQEYGTNVQVLDWIDDGILFTEGERQAAVSAMTEPLETWMPSGDADVPSGMTALRIADDPGISPVDIAAWSAMVDDLVEVGHRRLTINWTKAGFGNFTTICIVNDVAIVYDSMFSNAGGGGIPSPLNRRCLDYRMWWIWERFASSNPADWTRGQITADNNPTCQNGQVIACDKSCDASMTAGEARIECRSQQVPGTQCCQLEYNWGWATGFKKIALGADGFTLEIEGIIGSSGAGNGSCTECCDPVPAERKTWGTIKSLHR